MKNISILLFLATLCLLPSLLKAQGVTTSSISGTVVDTKGEPLIGATVYSVPGDFNNYTLYQFEGYEADGTTPQFTYRGTETGKERFDIDGFNSRWQMRVGVRYLFN